MLTENQIRLQSTHMSKTTTIQEVKELIKAETGKTIQALKAESRAVCDDDGCYKRIPVTAGLCVRFVASRNYQGGVQNGGGAGLYVSAMSCGIGSQTVKIG